MMFAEYLVCCPLLRTDCVAALGICVHTSHCSLPSVCENPAKRGMTVEEAPCSGATPGSGVCPKAMPFTDTFFGICPGLA